MNDQKRDGELSLPALAACWNAAGLVAGAEIATTWGASLSPLWLAAPGAVAAVGAAVCVRHEMAADVAVTHRARRLVTFLAGCAGLGDTAWLTWAQCAHTVATLPQMGTLAAATLAGFGMAKVIGRSIARRAEGLRTGAVAAQPIADTRRPLWDRILADAGIVAEVAEQGSFDGGVVVRLRLEPRRLRDVLGTGVAEMVAAAAARALPQHPIGSDSVTVSRGKRADEALIHVMTRDVMAETRPVGVTHDPVSIQDWFTVGDYVGGEPVSLCLLRRHFEIIGMTQSGKSSLLNQIVDFVLRCTDAVLWMGGTWKFQHAVTPWVSECLKKGFLPGMDWLASTQDDILAMLATAWQLADFRSRLVHSEGERPEYTSPEFPAVVVVIDEAWKPLKDRQKIRCHDGIERTASDLVETIVRGATSSEVIIILATQRAVNDEYGPNNTNIRANISNRVLLNTEGASDVWKVITNQDVPVRMSALKGGAGACYPQVNGGNPRLAKLRFLDTRLIAPMAWERSCSKVLLDARSRDAATFQNAYASRWGSSPEEFRSRLYGAGTSMTAFGAGMSSTRPAGGSGGGVDVAEVLRQAEETRARIRARNARLDAAKISDEEVDSRFEELTTNWVSERETDVLLRAKPSIVAVVRGAGDKGMTLGEISKALPNVGYKTVANNLTELKDSGVLRQDKRGGRYFFVTDHGE